MTSKARAGVTDLKMTQLETLSQFASETATLEHRGQQANLTVKDARAAKGMTVEKQ